MNINDPLKPPSNQGSSPALSRLVAVDPRSIWAHEAHQFTPWLAAQADRLSEALGIDLELSASEHPVGGYSLDLIGRDLTLDAPLIVENQLADSDHSHLGQLLTYAGGTDASTIVWIATKIRDEHRQALTWLNEQTGQNVRFFGIEIEVMRIDESLPAPRFNVVVQPNDWQKQARVAASAAKLRGKAPLYQAFWAKFLDRIHQEHPDWTRARAPSTNSWMNMRSPVRGTALVPSFAANARLRSEIYIDTGDGSENEQIFDKLAAQKAEFEAAYGGPLSWEPLKGKQACRIADYTNGDVVNQDEHSAYLDWFIDSGMRLRQALNAMKWSL